MVHTAAFTFDFVVSNGMTTYPAQLRSDIPCNLVAIQIKGTSHSLHSADVFKLQGIYYLSIKSSYMNKKTLKM